MWLFSLGLIFLWLVTAIFLLRRMTTTLENNLTTICAEATQSSTTESGSRVTVYMGKNNGSSCGCGVEYFIKIKTDYDNRPTATGLTRGVATAPNSVCGDSTCGDDDDKVDFGGDIEML